MAAAVRVNIATQAARRLWNNAAGIYDQAIVPALADTHRAVRALLGDVDGARALDLGCGTGVLGQMLAEGGATVTAVDVAPFMVDQARRRLAPYPSVERVAVMDAQALDLPDGAFDVVAASLSLMFCPDHAAAFAQAHRVLRPGGRFAMACWGTPHECETVTVGRVAATFATGPAPAGTPTGQSLGDGDVLRGLLEVAGFQDIEMTKRGMRLRYPGADALWQAMLHVHGERIPADRVEDARRATMTEIARVGLPLHNACWLVRARA